MNVPSTDISCIGLPLERWNVRCPLDRSVTRWNRWNAIKTQALFRKAEYFVGESNSLIGTRTQCMRILSLLRAAVQRMSMCRGRSEPALSAQHEPVVLILVPVYADRQIKRGCRAGVLYRRWGESLVVASSACESGWSLTGVDCS